MANVADTTVVLSTPVPITTPTPVIPTSGTAVG
jgi:hypothetical protein